MCRDWLDKTPEFKASYDAEMQKMAFVFHNELVHVRLLYYKYKEDLKRVRKEQKRVYHGSDGFDDLEAEILYLSIREQKPKTVIEISPNNGWSTMWMLHALKDNGFGKLHSYDLHDTCVQRLNSVFPETNNKDFWEFHLGDVKISSELPKLEDIDYIFIDSDHGKDMAEWYIKEILNPIHANKEKTVGVTIHDVFRYGLLWVEPEAPIVFKYLKDNYLHYYSVAAENFDLIRESLKELREVLGIKELIHWSEADPAVFFKIGKV